MRHCFSERVPTCSATLAHDKPEVMLSAGGVGGEWDREKERGIESVCVCWCVGERGRGDRMGQICLLEVEGNKRVTKLKC